MMERFIYVSGWANRDYQKTVEVVAEFEFRSIGVVNYNKLYYS